MKGDEGIDAAQAGRDDALFFDRRRHSSFDFRKSFVAQRLRIFRVALRIAKIFIQHRRLFQQIAKTCGIELHTRSSNDISGAYDAVIATRSNRTLPHAHAVIDNIAFSNHLVIGNTRPRICISIRFRCRINAI